MKSGMRVTVDRMKEVLNIIQEFESTIVLVGIPSEEAGRGEGAVTNTELGRIHEYGAPAAGIPPRPFLEPGVSDARDEAAALFAEGASAALDGDRSAMRRSLSRAGEVAVKTVQARFNNNNWAPLTEAALRSRARRHKYLKKKGKLQANAQPLIDTGKLRRSITYVLRKVK